MNRLASAALVLALAHPSQADELSPKIDEIFADYDSTRSPGCAVALIRDGRIVYKRGYGMANLDHDVPISPSTVFHVAYHGWGLADTRDLSVFGIRRPNR